MQFFEELGSLVEQRWRNQSYGEGVFPEIAEQALAEVGALERVDPWGIIDWLNTTTHLPEQHDIGAFFGNPPITLFNGPRFFIDVYYWLDGTTSIHQHAFCGAFQVLLGSSLHSRYDFHEWQAINAHFSVGQIALREVELLKQGDVRRILPGRQYIHSLFHLDRPSATIAVRTRRTPGEQPQYNFHKPHFAVDPFYESALMYKRLQSASLLLSMNHPRADELIGEMLACSDFQTAFETIEIIYNRLVHNRLQETFGLSTGRERFAALLDIARRRHGRLVDLIPAAFDEVQRQNDLIHRRGQITSDAHRYFLALLLNVPDRIKVLDLVQARFPDEHPATTIVNWVEELANTKAIGSSEPNVLGIADVDDDYLFVFECMLKGFTLEQIRQAFVEELSATEAEGLRDKPESIYNAIRHSMTFKSLFPDQSVTAADGTIH